MEVSKKGQIIYSGDLSAKGTISASELKVQSATVSNDIVINGNLVVTGDIINKEFENKGKISTDIENNKVNTVNLEATTVYFSKTNEQGEYPDGTWRMRTQDGELLIEHFENGVWEIRQSMV